MGMTRVKTERPSQLIAPERPGQHILGRCGDFRKHVPHRKAARDRDRLRQSQGRKVLDRTGLPGRSRTVRTPLPNLPRFPGHVTFAHPMLGTEKGCAIRRQRWHSRAERWREADLSSESNVSCTASNARKADGWRIPATSSFRSPSEFVLSKFSFSLVLGFGSKAPFNDQWGWGSRENWSGFHFGAKTVPTLYRVIAPDGNSIGEGRSIDEVVEIVKLAKRGRYRIDLVQTEAESGVASSRTWGAVIKTKRGQVKLDAPPWVD
jgi:hypothetical protein